MLCSERPWRVHITSLTNQYFFWLLFVRKMNKAHHSDRHCTSRIVKIKLLPFWKLFLPIRTYCTTILGNITRNSSSQVDWFFQPITKIKLLIYDSYSIVFIYLFTNRNFYRNPNWCSPQLSNLIYKVIIKFYRNNKIYNEYQEYKQKQLK